MREKQAFQNAELALKNKNWDIAVSEYSKALADNPDNAELKMKLNMAKMFASRLIMKNPSDIATDSQNAAADHGTRGFHRFGPGKRKLLRNNWRNCKHQIQHPELAVVETKPAERPLSELPSMALQPEFSR